MQLVGSRTNGHVTLSPVGLIETQDAGASSQTVQNEVEKNDIVASGLGTCSNFILPLFEIP